MSRWYPAQVFIWPDLASKKKHGKGEAGTKYGSNAYPEMLCPGDSPAFSAFLCSCRFGVRSEGDWHLACSASARLWGDIYSVPGPRLVSGGAVMRHGYCLPCAPSETKGQELGGIGTRALSEWRFSRHRTDRGELSPRSWSGVEVRGLSAQRVGLCQSHQDRRCRAAGTPSCKAFPGGHAPHTWFPNSLTLKEQLYRFGLEKEKEECLPGLAL